MLKKRQDKPRKRGFFHKIPFKYEIALGAATFILLLSGLALFWFATTPIPDINNFETRRVPQSTKIYDRTGTVLLYDVHGAIRRTTVPLDTISPLIQKAVIAIEDPSFYTHGGISLRAILRAIVADISTLDFSQGGSTITQQVVKNTILTTEKTLTRKIKEWVLAIKLEQTYSKDEILNVYLNETPYGGTIYGIEEASQYFFGKPAADVNLAEAAYLAAIPQAPTYYSPHGNHREQLDARKNLVLQKMFEQGSISETERDDAMNEDVRFVEEASVGIKAPHFVFYVQEYLEQKYGADVVNGEGLKVTTTLDYDLQKKAEEVVKEYALSNEKNFNASNAGLVAIDPNTGQILTMVGSRDYFDPEIDGKYNIAVADRQPGSTFKPFIYATAFAAGYTPDTMLYNLRTQFAASCAPDFLETTDTCYSPKNYDDVYSGPMSLRNALAQSVNIVAVKLLYLVGINNALATAERMGITTLGTAAQYGLTLVLGGGEVKLLDMVSAYGAFATEGTLHEKTAILKVANMNGAVLEEYRDNAKQVLDVETTRKISDILSDNTARTPAYGSNSSLYFPGFDVAAKTGTTNDSKDAWIVGYTPSIVIGTWAGNNDSSPMVKKVAGLIVAPMWHEVMQAAMDKYPAGQFIKPEPVDQNLPPILRGVWNTPGSDGRLHSILYWIDPSNPTAGTRTTSPTTDSQFTLWEYPIQLWSTFGYTGTSTVQQATPSTETFTITSPAPNSRIPLNASVAVTIVPVNASTITNALYYVDGKLVGTANSAPFTTSIYFGNGGSHTIGVTAQGSFGTASKAITVLVQ